MILSKHSSVLISTFCRELKIVCVFLFMIETRDAAFEAAPLVRKPISSVLEKIRRRKEEISKQ